MPKNVFGFIKPKLAVFTTPNQEFNILFPDFEGPFRHWDHKFEWTRSEFEDWAIKIVREYPLYEYKIYGIGTGPPGTESTHGHCSQMVVFINKEFKAALSNGNYEDFDFLQNQEKKPKLTEINVSASSQLPYKLMDTHAFIHRIDERSFEQKVLDELTYYSRQVAVDSTEWAEARPAHLSLEFLLGFPKIDELNCSVDQAKDILLANGYNVTTDEDGYVQLILPPEDPPDSEDEDYNFAVHAYDDVQEALNMPDIEALEEEDWE